MCGCTMNGSRESSAVTGSQSQASPAGEGLRPYTCMYAVEQSDRSILPEKPSNKGSAAKEGLAMDRRRGWREGA
jgi:hypothetical protein